MWDLMKSSPLLPGVDEIRLPGERSAQIYSERIENGIPIPPDLERGLRELASRVGVAEL